AQRTADYNAYLEYTAQLHEDYNYEQAYNAYLETINAGRPATPPVKPEGFDQRQAGQSTTAWRGNTAIQAKGNGIAAPPTAVNITPSVSYSSSATNQTAPKVGDQWQVIVTGNPGQPVYAVRDGVSTFMGTIGNTNRLILSGTFSASDLSSGSAATAWNENWYVGADPSANSKSAVSAGQVNFTLNPVNVGNGTIAATTGANATYGASITQNSDGTFIVTLNDGSKTAITASSLPDLAQQMQQYNTASKDDQKLLASFSQAYNQLTKNTLATNVTGSGTPITSTSKAGALAFSNDKGGSGLGVGNNWVVNIKGSTPNAPVYAYGGVNGSVGWMYLGTTDNNGNLQVTGPTLGSGDVGNWDVQIMVGQSGDAHPDKAMTAVAAPSNATQVGSDLQFGVGTSKITTPATMTLTFIQNVQGSGPTGSYHLNSAYYATQDSANWLAKQYGGKAILVTPQLGGPFSWPAQYYIQFPDGTTINAGELASAYNGGPVGGGGDKAAQSVISSEQVYHKASTGSTTPDGVAVVSWSYDPLQQYVGTDAQGRYVKIQDGQWEVSETNGPNAMWVALTESGPAKITNFAPTKQGESLYGKAQAPGFTATSGASGGTTGGTVTGGGTAAGAGASGGTTTGTFGSQLTAPSLTSAQFNQQNYRLTISGSGLSTNSAGNIVMVINSAGQVTIVPVVSVGSGQLVVQLPGSLPTGNYQVQVTNVSASANPSNRVSFVIPSTGSGVTLLTTDQVGSKANSGLTTDQLSTSRFSAGLTVDQLQGAGTGSGGGGATGGGATSGGSGLGNGGNYGPSTNYYYYGGGSTGVSAQSAGLQMADLSGGQVAGTSTFQGLQYPGLQMPVTGNDLSQIYANVNGTIYDKTTGYAFTSPEDFFNAAHVSSFDSLIFDTTWRPGGAVAGASTTAGQTAYTVKKGDTLWGIAKKYYGDGRQWRKIIAANSKQVKSPKSLKVGTVLIIPGK
ncbi:MAG: LysM peptidoglycan-binding domain-containing protein, partial [Patescibacteria group bacterium]|nr:LysM peptidoglycan-binding domain-containing protein [Patescibacteria group bacterium]